MGLTNDYSMSRSLSLQASFRVNEVKVKSRWEFNIQYRRQFSNRVMVYKIHIYLFLLRKIRRPNNHQEYERTRRRRLMIHAWKGANFNTPTNELLIHKDYPGSSHEHERRIWHLNRWEKPTITERKRLWSNILRGGLSACSQGIGNCTPTIHRGTKTHTQN